MKACALFPETAPNHWPYDPDKVQNDVKIEKKEERGDRNEKAMQHYSCFYIGNFDLSGPVVKNPGRDSI